MGMATLGRPTRDELLALIGTGEVDTVILAITDMQGRLQGKRLDAVYFADEVVGAAVEGCSYLLASDVDMRTVDGFALTSWERGYGDLAFRPDFDTIRLVPWFDKTAIIFADVETVDGEAVAVSPRQVLQHQERAPGPARVARPHRHGARVHRLPGHLRGRVAPGVPRPDPGEPLQRRLLAPGDLARSRACSVGSGARCATRGCWSSR